VVFAQSDEKGFADAVSRGKNPTSVYQSSAAKRPLYIAEKLKIAIIFNLPLHLVFVENGHLPRPVTFLRWVAANNSGQSRVFDLENSTSRLLVFIVQVFALI